MPQGLAANFCAGFSVVLGGVLMLAVSLSDEAIGAILVMSAGVYAVAVRTGRPSKQVGLSSGRARVLRAELQRNYVATSQDTAYQNNRSEDE